jgi:hypothetical protein
MNKSLRIGGLLFLGFLAGVGCTLGVLFYLFLHQLDSVKRMAVRANPELRNAFDPKRRLAKADNELATAASEYNRWLALGDAAMMKF